MITFPHLGYLGRLANQMFQYAALVNISNKNKSKYFINSSKIELLKCFDLPAKIFSLYNSEVSTPNKFSMTVIGSPYTVDIAPDEDDKLFSTKFDEEFYNSDHENKSLVGFFQNYNYFKDSEDVLRKHFIFKKQYLNVSNYYFKEIFSGQKVISLHIRRTDYLESTILNHLDFDYYQNALNKFDKSIPVLVFSDDVEWCEQQDFFKSERFVIIRTNNTYIDLCLMSMCDYHIIANSSFSWWGSWLAKSKKTICPQNWFSSNFSYLDSDGLRLPNWISV